MTTLYAIKVPASLPPDVFDNVLAFLEPDSQARIRRFHHQDDAIRSLFGRLAPIWYLLDTGILPRASLSTLRFGEEGKGKPIIIQPVLDPCVEYNISHDGEYVLFGTSRGKRLGVDILKIPSSPDEVEEALSDQMAMPERRSISLPLSPGEKAERLTRIWCIKEAYVKAIGEGVGFGLQRIEVCLGDDGSLEGVKVDGKSLGDNGWMVSLGTLEGYIWACVTEKSSEQMAEPKIVSYRDIIDVLQP